MLDSNNVSQTNINSDSTTAYPIGAPDCPGAVEHAIERRKNPKPSSVDGLLEQLPARVLLDRMPAPAIGLDHDGAIVCANRSSASMLGFQDVATLLERPSPSLLAGHSLSSPAEYVAFLQDADNVVADWCHADGFQLRTKVTKLLLRATDPVLIVYIDDITELLWMKAPKQSRRNDVCESDSA